MRNKILKSLVVFVLIFAFVGISLAKDVHVKGYYRKDGTYVQPHYRSAPNNTVRDNWNYKGNVNPYTGKVGTNEYKNNPTSEYYNDSTSNDNSSQVAQQENVFQKNYDGKTTHKVVRIIDGDTIVVNDGTKLINIRLIGVDTPETVHPQKSVETYGKEASQFTSNLLKGESVYLEYETGIPQQDKYGRTLAYVYRVPDGLFVNLEIIRQGYGHAYTQYPFKYMELFRLDEKKAREAGKGLWGQGLSNIEETTTQTTSPTPSVEQKIQKSTSTKETQETTVYITRTGEKYHRAGCRYLSKSMIPISLIEARQRGYTPCSVCNPPP